MISPKEKININIISNYNLEICSNLIAESENKNYNFNCKYFMGNILSSINQIKKEEKKTSFTFFWNDISELSNEFNRALRFEEVNLEKFDEEINLICLTLEKIKQYTPNIFLISFSEIFYPRGNSLFQNFSPKMGTGYLINRANNLIAEYFFKNENFYIINSNSLSDLSFEKNSWYLAKIPFQIKTLKNISILIKNLVLSLKGESKKLIICDLDNTLWGGIIGDDGINGIDLGGHNPAGEAYKDFQKFLKNQKNKGIILAISSKNEIKHVKKAFKNEEMILKMEDFVEIKCNWDDKAKNISEIFNKLNISPNYTVFLDDSPVERNRVKEVFPEIESPDYMDNIFDAIEKIHKETWFENVNLTTEDRLRTDSYIASKKIKKMSNYNFNQEEIDNWIKNLEIKIFQSKLSDKNLKRTIQLMNKTNQLNTITRRMTEEEFLKWKKDYNAETYTYRVKDKFTDYGLTAILSLIYNKQEVKIYDFILSCRIMGRNIENKILQDVIEKYSQKSKNLIVQFNHTEKNKPMFKSLMDSGLSNKESGFFWDLNKKYKKLNQIQMLEAD